MDLRLPESIRNDQYYGVLATVVEEMLDELHSNIGITEDWLSTGTKLELLILAESYGIDKVFKRLPIDRGRTLLKEFQYLMKTKGTAEAIKRMAQIYLGVVNCSITYNSDNKSYSLDNLYYGEVSSADSLYISTIYDAISHVNPVGRKLLSINAYLEYPILVTTELTTKLPLYIRDSILLGTRISDTVMRCGDLYNHKAYPENTDRNDITSVYFKLFKPVSAKTSLDPMVSLERLEDTIYGVPFKELGSNKTMDDVSTFKTYPKNVDRKELPIVIKREEY